MKSLIYCICLVLPYNIYADDFRWYQFDNGVTGFSEYEDDGYRRYQFSDGTQGYTHEDETGFKTYNSNRGSGFRDGGPSRYGRQERWRRFR